MQFLGIKKWANQPGPKVQSCRSQKVGPSKRCPIFDLMQFAHAQCALVGSVCRKELLLQQNRFKDKIRFALWRIKHVQTFWRNRTSYFLSK